MSKAAFLLIYLRIFVVVIEGALLTKAVIPARITYPFAIYIFAGMIENALDGPGHGYPKSPCYTPQGAAIFCI
jgi:hypothetical protein